MGCVWVCVLGLLWSICVVIELCLFLCLVVFEFVCLSGFVCGCGLWLRLSLFVVGCVSCVFCVD